VVYCDYTLPEVNCLKKRILCYGDSNTYGYNPAGGRYDETIRWPMKMQELLGDGYTVVEEGFNGRTICYDDPAEGGYKSGMTYMPPCLMTHSPLDLVIIMLGTNDTKQRFGLNAYTIAYCMNLMVQCARQYGLQQSGDSAKVLIVSPPEIGQWVGDTLMGPIFGPNAPEISRGLRTEYARFAKLLRCECMAASDYCKPSKIDGVHLNPDGQIALAKGICEKVKQIIG
jgi:lysophospholipase L1-like esterase